MTPLFPPVFLWTLGLASAVALIRLMRHEFIRVNDELNRQRNEQVASDDERNEHPTLKRDPQTGIYHP